jgi:hypothetical protein
MPLTMVNSVSFIVQGYVQNCYVVLSEVLLLFSENNSPQASKFAKWILSQNLTYLLYCTKIAYNKTN